MQVTERFPLFEGQSIFCYEEYEGTIARKRLVPTRQISPVYILLEGIRSLNLLILVRIFNSVSY